MAIGPLPDRLVLIFDGSCDFCTRSKRLVEWLDRHGRVAAVPFQQPGMPERAGLTVAECEAAAWALADDRRRYRGAAAVNIALSVALGTNLPIWLYSLPLVRPLQDAIYRLVARYRSWLPGDTPFCEQFPEQCGQR